MAFFILFLILAIGGRWACGKLCPLGIIEELIFKIPFPKKYLELPYEKYLKKIKYIIFVLLLFLIPTIFIPNQDNWKADFLSLKLFGFTTIFVLSLFVYRPFCKYFCPFGVFLGFFNRISLYRYEVDSSCNHCSLCKKKCKMGLTPYMNPNHMECIRCGACLNKCPKKALYRKSWREKKNRDDILQ